jgi:outer membrane protein assembly factor BamB
MKRRWSLLAFSVVTMLTSASTGAQQGAQPAKPAVKPVTKQTAAAAARGDWPQWHGPKRDNVSTETGLLRQWGPEGPALAWQASGLGLGFSSLAITNGRIFTMGDHGAEQFIEALDAQSGTMLWKTKVGPSHEDEYGGPRSTPTVDGALLYAVGTEGDLVCLDTATGKEVWRRSLPKDFGGRMMSDWKFSESPLVDGDRVIVTPGAREATLVALDKKTGKEVWRTATPDLGPAGRDGAAYSSVVISNGAGVKQYVQLLGRGVIGVRASDGKFLWNYNGVANQVANIATPLVQGDYVFASTGYQTGSALVKLAKSGDGVSATEVYKLDGKTFQNHHGGYVLIGQHIYGGHGHRRGAPICIDLTSGKVVWGGEGTKGEGTGSAAVTTADNLLYFRYEDGTMTLIEATPTGYQPKGHFKIPGVSRPSWAHPVVLNGKLYLREDDKLLVYNVSQTS